MHVPAVLIRVPIVQYFTFAVIGRVLLQSATYPNSRSQGYPSAWMLYSTARRQGLNGTGNVFEFRGCAKQYCSTIVVVVPNPRHSVF